MRHDSAHRNTLRQHVSSALLCWAPGWSKTGPWWRLELFLESGARATKHREGDGVDTSLSKLHVATRNAHVDANFQGCE